VVVVPKTLLLFASKATIVTPASGSPLSVTFPENVLVGHGIAGSVSPPPPPPQAVRRTDPQTSIAATAAKQQFGGTKRCPATAAVPMATNPCA